MLVFCSVYAANSNSVVCGIVLERFNLEGYIECLVFTFDKLGWFFLYTSMAYSCDVVVNVHEIVYVPYIIWVLLAVYFYSENFVFEVYDFFDDFHFVSKIK